MSSSSSRNSSVMKCLHSGRGGGGIGGGGSEGGGGGKGGGSDKGGGGGMPTYGGIT